MTYNMKQVIHSIMPSSTSAEPIYFAALTLPRRALRTERNPRTAAAMPVNGLVSGFSSSSLDSPVTKYVKSVTFIPFVHKPLQNASECIRCGSCRRVCPLNLYPDILYRHVSGGAIAQIEYLKTAQFCSDCGLCNSYCPSRLPISQKIAEIKKNFHYNSGEEK